MNQVEWASPAIEDGAADQAQLDALAVGFEGPSVGTPLTPAVLLAVLDGIVPAPASRYPQLPPRPPPCAT